MKNILSIILSCFILASCGGGGLLDGGSDLVDGGGDSQPPTISAIAGTGPSGEVLDSLEVTGTNFMNAPDMLVYLVGSAATVALDFELESSEQFNVDLPLDIEPGDFDLQIETPAGDTSAPLSLLQGETGAEGPQGPAGPEGETGPAGADGISYATSWECGSSSDLDPDAQITKSGVIANVYQFSDGSYFVSCIVYYEDGSGPIIDYSTGVSFVTQDRAEFLGYAEAKPAHVGCEFHLDGEELLWYVIGDHATNETVACTQ